MTSSQSVAGANRPLQLGPATQTQPAAQPGSQQLLNQFYSAAQALSEKIDKTPGLRDKLDDDLHVAEFLESLDRIAKSDCSAEDLRAVQGFLRNNLKMTNIGDADGKVGPKLVQALQQAFGPLSKYNPPAVPIPTPRPPGIDNQVVQRASTPIPVNSVLFPDRTNPTQAVFSPQPLVSDGSRSAEASLVIADIAKVVSARSGSPGGKCFAGVKNILSQLDKIGHAAELGPKSKEYKQMLAKYPKLKPILEKMAADPGLAAAVRQGQMLFPPDSGSAFMAAKTFDQPDSPYRMVSQGSNDSVDEAALQDPTRFPPGAVIVWDRSPLISRSQEKGPDGKPTKEAKAAAAEIASMKKHGEWERGHVHGHIAVIGGNGHEYSDRDYNFKPHYGGGSFKVYVLK